MPPFVTKPKLLVITLFTGSLKLTVQCNDVAFVGFASARTSDDTVGAVRSTTHVYDVAELVRLPCCWNARTWNVCEPDANPEYVFVLGRVVPQSTNEPLSNEHWNFVTACESVYVNDADV
jgi:hypothetical protein